MPGTGPSPRLRRVRWIAIALVTAAIALDYMDRSTHMNTVVDEARLEKYAGAAIAAA